ncbi:ATP-binding protein [Maioricimonas sp. JC845]|uniref:ATP-binding protein n=1 Tax=Maioricimonas sp. JC845 TaxID=3232138 RepID=UPI00345A878E
MIEALFDRCRQHYILLMILVNRLLAMAIGGFCTYYVILTFRLNLTPEISRNVIIACSIWILIGAIGTTAVALRGTRNLRAFLKHSLDGGVFDKRQALLAAQEAVLFPGRQTRAEAAIDHFLTTIPICLSLHALGAAPWKIVAQVAVTGFIGVGCILFVGFFMFERWLKPVIRSLLESGVEVPFELYPVARLGMRLQLGFGLVVAVTALMIGSLGMQRAIEIINSPSNQIEALNSLRNHAYIISMVAFSVGIWFSQLLAGSVTSRVLAIVDAMNAVKAGNLTERVRATGTDEIDQLARHFNAMVHELETKDRVVRDLNTNLEKKVRNRTRELMKSKRSLQKSYKKLRESDRHKTEFFSNVSHELRTPLMMILSPIEQLLRRERDSLPRQSAALLEVAQVNANRLLKQINQLLEFSRIEAGHTTLQAMTISAGSRAAALANAARPLAEQRGLKLETRVEQGLPPMVADPEKLDIIVTNLVSNAVKFTPSGGTVTLVVERGSARFGIPEEMLCITVEDTGIGIAPEHFDRLFERFQQVDGSSSREFAGTGLGLALVKELVELHGGTIQVDSVVGDGTAFCVAIPIQTSADAPPIDSSDDSQVFRREAFADLVEVQPQDFATTSQQPVGKGAARILVVDDTPDVRHMIGEILSDTYEIVFAGDGVEGLEVLERMQPDLVLSDVMMPRMDGYEFCRTVKGNPDHAAIPFVLVTAKAQLSMKIDGLNCGADDYIVKPFAAEELCARVRSLLRVRQLHKQLNARNTELQETLNNLRQAQDQLIQSEKMSSLGQLVAGLAHEINNAINAVYNGIPTLITRTEKVQKLVDMALESLEEEEQRNKIDLSFSKIGRLADAIREGAVRTARIVSDMKSFAHPGCQQEEESDIHRTLDVCLNLLSNECKGRVEIYRNYDDVGPVWGPFGQLDQLFLNLFSNAIQAMPDGGELHVSTVASTGSLEISVRDTGCGIPESVRNRIFDPFFTTKPVGVGTGLGLSIGYGIVERLGGTIECDSVEGEGTEFRITLPLKWERPAAAGRANLVDTVASTRV